MATNPLFFVTPAAAARIKKALSEIQNQKKTGLRVDVLPGGCSGFQYEFKLVDGPDADDQIVEKDGAKVFIDETSMQFLQGAELDFEDKLMGAHFLIKNPNASSACGCGNSFTPAQP